MGVDGALTTAASQTSESKASLAGHMGTKVENADTLPA